MDMIERVAKALSQQLDKDGYYVDAARAAIEAMRDPTEAMVEAGEKHVRVGRLAEEKYKAMIDAALNEHEGAEKRQSAVTKQAAINKIIDEDPVNNWWLEEDAFEGWK